jgi:hypothetical protein
MRARSQLAINIEALWGSEQLPGADGWRARRLNNTAHMGRHSAGFRASMVLKACRPSQCTSVEATFPGVSIITFGTRTGVP